MSSKHKSHISDKDCCCAECPLRFACFTEERVFSDPVWQSLFEALMALGEHSREEAIESVANEIKMKSANNIINIAPFSEENDVNIPYVPYVPVSYPGTAIPNWTYNFPLSESYGDSVDVGCKNIMTYTMCGGKEVSWVTDGIFN